MDKNGGDSKTLKWVEIPLSAAGAALAEHRVDVAAMLEPALTAALDTGRVRILAPGFNAIAERFIIGLLFANADWAAKHPDAAKKWIRVTYEAGAYTNTHRSEPAQLMSDVTKIPLPLFSKMTVPSAADGDRRSGLLQPLIDVAARYNTSRARFRRGTSLQRLIGGCRNSKQGCADQRLGPRTGAVEARLFAARARVMVTDVLEEEGRAVEAESGESGAFTALD